MVDEYKKELQERYAWYINKIESLSVNNMSTTDSFYYKLHNKKIKILLDDIEWLEDAISKLQASLAIVEKYIERETYKTKIGADFISRTKRL
jgi:hypothetical protein